MNIEFDRIRDIRSKLTALPCLSCHQQRLGLVLRFDQHKGRVLFVAYCKSCGTKFAVYPDTTHFLDDRGLHTSSLHQDLSHGVMLREVPNDS